MGSVRRERALRRLVDLSTEGLDLVALWHAAAEILSPVVPNYTGPCWFTLDPASLLITSHFNDEMPEFPHDALLLEYYEDDVQTLAAVARSPRGVSTLHEATGGDPASSARWHANMALGGDQELIVALRSSDGATWGALSLYREPGRPMFDRDEVAFLRAAAPALGEGARRALLLGEALEPEGPDAPGLVVLSAAGQVESATAAAERWLSDLPGGDWDAGRIPAAVLAVAGRALGASRQGGAPGEVALARVLSGSGRWVALHGATLQGDGVQRVVVVVEPAHPAYITPLLMTAYGLTRREQDVTRLVLQGEPTVTIAERLSLAPNTVQQHLKRVFEKTGVRSRRDLVGKVFFAYYEPRLRDNEARTRDGKALRGGPAPR